MPTRWDPARTVRVLVMALAATLWAQPAAAADPDPDRASFGTRAGAKVIRAVFDGEARRTRRALEKHLPSSEVTVVEDLAYLPGDDDARVDVYFPASTPEGERLPTVVWIHGGAWLSGSRKDAAPWFRLLADRGYTVVAPGYSLAPGATYPTPLRQLTALKAWLDADPGTLHIDTGRLFLAGDSAGAQLAAQLALLGSDEAYAGSVGIPGAYARSQVRGVLLNCGVFDLPALVRRDRGRSRIMAWGTGTAAVAYAGTRDPDSPRLAQMSPVNHVTAAFPPTWISGGNADPLTEGHSKPLAARLRALGVPVTDLFWPGDHEPGLEHEYQFDLDNEEGRAAFESMVAFLRERQ